MFGEEEEYSNRLQQDNLEDYNLETAAVKEAPKLRLLLFVFATLASSLSGGALKLKRKQRRIV